ncbi:MAG TPA: APC family permease [Ktedonobacteraceae bacterium]
MLQNRSAESAPEKASAALSQMPQPALPSEQLPEGWLPRILRGSDLTVLCLFSVLLVTNVPGIAGAGGAAFLYWGLGFVTFLIPSALVCAQLYRLFPGEGAVYLWANKAFGSFWDSFLGLFCNWWPGAIGLTVEAGACIAAIQALNPALLQPAWQQGLAEIGVLLLAQFLCSLGQRRLQVILNSVFMAYLLMFLLLGFAGLVYIAAGHHIQGDLSPQSWQVQSANFPVFATVILSLLGMAVPLNLGAEIIHRKAANRYLLWGTVITIGVYLLATLAVIAILPPADLFNPAFLTEVFRSAFGPILGNALGFLNYVILIVYFICATAAFNMLFARLLLVAGVDRRLPVAMRRLSVKRVPFNATLVQTIFNIVFVAAIFLVAPSFAPSSQGLSTLVFLITINGAALVWYIAMIGLFLCGLILFVRYSRQLVGKWLLPRFLLTLACLSGIGAAGIAIYFTLFAGSPLPQILDNQNWFYWVLLVTLGSLAIGATYSFLVPESEDLVALARAGAAKNKQVSQHLAGPARSLNEGESYGRNPSTQLPGAFPGAIPTAAQPRFPGELFSDPAGQSGPGGYRGLS